jgi:hypothetical protein
VVEEVVVAAEVTAVAGPRTEAVVVEVVAATDPLVAAATEAVIVRVLRAIVRTRRVWSISASHALHTRQQTMLIQRMRLAKS